MHNNYTEAPIAGVFMAMVHNTTEWLANWQQVTSMLLAVYLSIIIINGLLDMRKKLSERRARKIEENVR